MSAKTRNDAESLEDHKYFNMGQDFIRELSAYLLGFDKVPVQYVAFIQSKKHIEFKCTKLVATATMKLAKQNSGNCEFSNNVGNSIALSNKDESNVHGAL